MPQYSLQKSGTVTLPSGFCDSDAATDSKRIVVRTSRDVAGNDLRADVRARDVEAVQDVRARGAQDTIGASRRKRDLRRLHACTAP